MFHKTFFHKNILDMSLQNISFNVQHYSDVIMCAMACQITSVLIVYSIICSGSDKKETSKLLITGLCEGNSPMSSEFPTQRAVTRKMFPFDDAIMNFLLCVALTTYHDSRFEWWRLSIVINQPCNHVNNILGFEISLGNKNRSFGMCETSINHAILARTTMPMLPDAL